jgi:hypothetical protein
MRFLVVVVSLMAPALLLAVEQSGTVRAADQFIPGATVTARQGGARVVAYTDENGRYSMDLAAGVWEIEVAMFGFRTQTAMVTIADQVASRDWILEMPRFREPAAAAPSPPNGRTGRGQPAFQSVDVTATDAGAQALATAGSDAPPELAALDSSDALIVNGSTSGGLGVASDEQQARLQAAGRGGRGGDGGPGGDLGLMTLGGDPLGMGGFGADAGGARGGMGGGRGGGGGGGRGGRGGGAGGTAGRGARGPFNGRFATIGNRRGRGRQSPYQGSVAITATNSALNAAPFSLNGQNQPKPSSATETIAGNFGGPVRFKNLITGDKWSFYVNFTNKDGRSATNQVSTVPTREQRAGDFSATTESVLTGGVRQNAPVVIYDPTDHAPFPNAAIPALRINPASRALLTYFPPPTYPDLTQQNYALSQSAPSLGNSVGLRLQGSISAKDRLNFNQQYSHTSSSSEQLFAFEDTTSGYGLSSSAGWTHFFKPRFNNNANLAFSRSYSKATPYFAYKDDVSGTLGISGTDTSPIDYGPPTLRFTNFGSLSDGAASLNRSQTVNFTDTVTYVAHKNHNLSFGIGYRRMQNNVLSYAGSRGSFTFGGLLTTGLDSSGRTIAATGYDFADYLLGYPQTSSLRTGNDNNYYRGWAGNAYANDDWRVGRGLTLNIGLRYEYFSPYTELFGHLATLDINPTFTAVDQVTAGGTGTYFGRYPAALIQPDPNNISPRFGFAWRPAQKNSRLIRGGYSIFYSGSSYSAMAAGMAGQPPFANQVSLTTTLTNPLTLQNGFPASPNTLTNTYAVNPDYKLAYTQTWTMALQQGLPHNLLMELEYVGIKGTGLQITLPPNQPLVPGDPTSALRIPGASSFSYVTGIADSIMHAGQVRLTRRFARGMSGVLLYTFSKSIDDDSNSVQNPYDLRAERALSSSDQRHRLSFNYVVSSPVGVRGLWRNGGWKTRMLAGWTLGGNFAYASGTPLTPTISGNVTSTKYNLRAWTTGAPLIGGGYPYFNLAAFTVPPTGQYGDAGRDIITGLPTFGLNAQLNRAWRFGETRKQIQLSFRTTNTLNHPQLTFNTTVNSAQYGQPLAANTAMRGVTCNLRFNF